jgi:hypothetical protein
VDNYTRFSLFAALLVALSLLAVRPPSALAQDSSSPRHFSTDRQRHEVDPGQSLSNLPASLGVGFPDDESRLKRVRYSAVGADLIGDSNLLAISPYDPAAPALRLQSFGISSKVESLKVGMQVKSMVDVLGQKPYVAMALITPEQSFYYLPCLGIALQLNGDKSTGKVTDVVLVQIAGDKTAKWKILRSSCRLRASTEWQRIR